MTKLNSTFDCHFGYRFPLAHSICLMRKQSIDLQAVMF